MSRYIKRNRKGQKSQFLNQLVLSFSHIDTHVSRRHFRKLVELLFFEVGNISISEAPFWMSIIVSVSIIIRITWDTEKKVESQKYRYRINLAEWHQTFCCASSPCVTFYYFFVNPFSRYWATYFSHLLNLHLLLSNPIKSFYSLFQAFLQFFWSHFDSASICQIYSTFSLLQIDVPLKIVYLRLKSLCYTFPFLYNALINER